MAYYQAPRKRNLMDEELAKHLYKKGASVEEIAAATGVTTAAVISWMERNDLPPIDKKTGLRKMKHPRSKLEWDVHDAEMMGLSYGAFKVKYPHGLHRGGKK